MSDILFSVVIPLYNKGDNIAHTLETVLRQTVSNFEVLVVNDGSTDGGEKIVAKCEDIRVRLVSQENQGVSVARNRGIQEAKGKYVAFLDADDEWTEDFLSVCLHLFEKYSQAKMVSPSYEVRYGKKAVLPKWRSVNMEQEDCLLYDFFEMATGAFWTTISSCVAIERSILLSMDRWFPENEKVYEDFDMWIRIGAQYPVAHSNMVCAVYNRTTPNNARKTHKAKIIYSTTYARTLEKLIEAPSTTEQQREWLHQIKDRRIVVYVFSLLCTRQRKKAKKVLKEWVASAPYKKYRFCLRCAALVPYFIIDLVQAVRLKVF